jgi:hypothetical protein
MDTSSSDIIGLYGSDILTVKLTNNLLAGIKSLSSDEKTGASYGADYSPPKRMSLSLYTIPEWYILLLRGGDISGNSKVLLLLTSNHSINFSMY